jgi:hypothetical protein
MPKMKILIACEESQAVCKAFRSLGHEAFSCDVQECSGEHPEWHIKGDAIAEAYSGNYDMMIAHPPCTYLSKAGARWMYPTAGIVSPERLKLAMEAKEFFLKLLNAPIQYIAIENPLPLKIVELPKPDDVIQPYQFGDPFSKKTFLWLKNLPPLTPTNILKEYTPFIPSNTGGVSRGQKFSKGIASGSRKRSKTFQGIAAAMASQWGNLIHKT